MTARETRETNRVETTAKPIGIRDVAKLAGVSVASASLALNGLPGVADGTRSRIAAAAERLGYRANPQAQALRSGRSTMYGFVVRNLANPFFLDVMSGAEEVASEAGATLIVLDSQYSIDREAEHVRNMAAQRLAGLAIAPVGAGASIQLWHQLRPGTPVVALNASLPGINGLSLVSPDNAAAVALPMQRLAELGHASAAFITAPRGLMADADRLRHFRQQASQLGMRGRVVYSPLTMSDVGRAARAVLSDARRPTSIITNSDYTAHAIYKAARELSLLVGPAISVIGHDDLPTSELLDPPLATIGIDRRQMGQALMARLLAQVPLGDFVAPVELIERPSLQPPEGGPRHGAYLHRWPSDGQGASSR
ncbi:MAG TPA: LacI family DNA-binding transcriptional regulator [Streptosporangiaceae bacterium]|nr:LacI family DNA-binding transcriptional regulator [Streptosporangiaceae bacterium]